MNTVRTRAGRRALKSTPVAAAVALMVWAPGYAVAQTAPAAQADQTVVVTGIRRAIESAIAAKKEADTIVEAITSEDLGKLPDPSVADSIARLPGVAAQRNKGSGKAQSTACAACRPISMAACSTAARWLLRVTAVAWTSTCTRRSCSMA